MDVIVITILGVMLTCGAACAIALRLMRHSYLDCDGHG